MEYLVWVGFLVLILAILALDLGVFHRRDHVIGVKEALWWTGFWVLLALIFNVFVYFLYKYHWLGVGLEIGHQLGGKQAALEFFTGYLLEKSLSLDNIFVIALIFSYFRVPAEFQHRILFWGILGALVFRGALIIAGVALIERYDWMVYVFGGLLIFTAVKLLISQQDNLDPDKSLIVNIVRRFYPISNEYVGNQFFTALNGKMAATPLFVALVMVEGSDVVFALDSIPAIFAVTKDPFIVFSSNVFAILGLRSLFFAIAAVMNKFVYMKTSLVFMLGFVGVKMTLAHHFEIPIIVSLAIIIGILLIGILASFVAARREK